MNASVSWVLAGALPAVGAIVAWFTVGWFAPLALAVAATACLGIGVAIGARRSRASGSA